MNHDITRSAERKANFALREVINAPLIFQGDFFVVVFESCLK